jgi:putative PIN family toxin of toxin-antitoxin system
MISAVFDCVVYVQAALSRTGPAFACLSLAEAELVALYLSPEILNEVRRTLDQPTLRRKYKQLTDERVSRFLEYLETIAVITQDPPPIFSLRRDPKDEPYVNLALETSSRFIVSRDADLLDLMEDEGFRKNYPRLTVLDPPAFLMYVREQAAKRT